MPIISDFHMHSSFSTDSDTPLRDMVESAISKGLTKICITEHQDHGYPYNSTFPEQSWMLNVDSYLYELLNLREEYKDKIDIGFGIEIGMQEHVLRENAITARSHEFDFIIASIHVVNGYDTYDHKYFDGRNVDDCVRDYFKATLNNIKKFNNFDVLGHCDYIVRTVPGGESVYSYNKFSDCIDPILEYLIENEKGIEINTSQLRKDGFKNPNPCPDIIKRYKELGGEIITIGSDAHVPRDVAGKFNEAEEILKAAGFSYYTVFSQRVAEFIKI